MNHSPTPPNWAVRLLQWFVKDPYLEEILGDMEERFQDNLSQFTPAKARRLYIIDTCKLLRPALLKGFSLRQLSMAMLSSNIKIAWRQMLANKVFSLIKIGGFAVGIAAFLLIAMYTTHQVSYDTHYKDGDRVFRLVNQWSQDGEVGMWSNVHGPLKFVLEDNIPEMESVARVVHWTWGDSGENHVRKPDSKYNVYEEGFLYADPELLEILEIPMMYGSSDALTAPNSLVISKSKADQFFPNQDPRGQQLLLNDNPESLYTIGGVMEDLPANSHFQADYIMTLAERKSGPGTSGWCCTNYSMYVKLTPHAEKEDVEEKTAVLRNSVVIGELRDDGQSGLEEMQKYQSYYLQPVNNIYLNPEEVGDFLLHGSLDLVRIFNYIALLVLILAGVNFVHLSIAKSIKRAKEVGLRKVVGSSRVKLVGQYLSESCLYSTLSIAVGVALATLLMPYFNVLANVNLALPWDSMYFISALVGGALVIGILSGLYPAFYLSGFRPIEALRGDSLGVQKAGSLRGILVIFQFAATMILITGAMVTHQQFQFLMNKQLGYQKDAVVNILGLEAIGDQQREVLKQELKTLSQVRNATMSDFLPVAGSKIENRSYWVNEKLATENGREAARWQIDEDYLETMQISLVQGRNFRTGTSDDASIIINETMAEVLLLDEPLGVKLIDMFDQEYTIIGVVDDFYFEALYVDIRPLAMVKGTGQSTLSIGLSTLDYGVMTSTLASVQDIWDRLGLNQNLRYVFMDDRFEQMYNDLQRTRTIFMLFAALAIIVAASGMFALSMFMVEQREKEISVRKVLGASAIRIYSILTFDFIKLVLLAIVLATPVAWFLMDEMLMDMANRVPLSWQMFAGAGLLAVTVAITAVSFESIKASMTSLAEKLRHG